jgi:ribosome-associated protein
MGLTTIELLQTAIRAAESRKATDSVILDLRGISSVTDFFIICSGTSDTTVKAIADAVEETLKKEGHPPLGVEGRQEKTWILLDYVDFVVHIFQHEKRLAFALENLWEDAKRVPVESTEAAAGK